MSFFRFHNADWSHLPQAVSFEQGGWGFEDNVPLAVLLNLTAAEIDRIGGLPVTYLRLSAIRNQSFADRGTTLISQLLEHTLSTLLESFSMGYGSVMVVLGQLLQTARAEELSAREPQEVSAEEHQAAPFTPATEETRRELVDQAVYSASTFVPATDSLELLTLRREWELFSGLPSCSAFLSLASVGLSEEIIKAIGTESLRALLDWKVADLVEQIGDDAAEEVLGALTTYAAEVRLLPDPGVLLRSERTHEQTQVLEERWGHLPIAALGLGGTAGRALRRASVVTVSDLLFALDPLHIELALDPLAFMIIWATLEKLGLRDENCEDAGERLSAEAYQRATLDHITAAWQNSISPHQWAIVSMRLHLVAQSSGDDSNWQMPTLDEVAAQFGMTRERVRQIEVHFLKRLTGRQDDYFAVLCNAMSMIISQAGGVIDLEQAVDDFKDWFNPGHAEPEGFCRLILNHSPSIVSIKKNRVFALTSSQASSYQVVVDIADRVAKSRTEEYSLEDLALAVAEEVSGSNIQKADADRLSLEFIRACLTAAGCFQKGVQQATPVVLVRLLRELGAPRHFNEITDRLNDSGWRKRQTTAKYVHNYLLSRRDLFVHVSAGTYGLVEWGLEDQRVGRGGEPIGDIMTVFLETRGIPASKDEIIAFVQTQKNCRGASVAQSLLYDSRFHRFDKDKYGLSKWTF